MQKKIKLLTIAFASFLISGCVNTNKPKTHIHDFSEEWSSNSNEHYHKCKGEGCNEVSGKAEHDFGNDGKCTVCGYYVEEKFSITLNGGESISYSGSYKNKNIGDIGLQNVESQLDDGGKLADPMWLEYYEVELQPGMNSIVIEAPTATKYSMYIGGFRLSY